MADKKIDKVIQIESIADLENYNLTNYINFVRRSGGQVFQHYSLLESYSNYLGYSDGNGFSSSYKETEVLFSREIYKRRVYSSVILPLYAEDFSSNNLSFDSSKTATGAAKSYFQPQLTPSWYDRHQNNIECFGGELRNIYKKATHRVDSIFSTGIELTGGELRLPLLRYYHRETDSILSNLTILSGELKKVLLKASMSIESFTNKDLLAVYFGKSTSVLNDVLEINFKSLVTPDASPKTESTILDTYSTVVDDRVFKTGEQSTRILNKAGGFKSKLRDSSTALYCSYDWSLEFNFYPRELSQSSVIYYYPSFLSVSLGADDPSILEVTALTGNKFRSVPNKISLNTWYTISVECFGGALYLYLNGELLQTVENKFVSTLEIFKSGETFYLGNDNTVLKGFIGNIDRFTFIKKVAVLTSNSDVKHQINPVMASKLKIDDSGNILDENPNVLWAFKSKPGVNIENKTIELGSSRYLEASLTENLSIYSFNNYRISITFSAESLPSLTVASKTLLHKTGALDYESDNASSAGYSLSIKRINDNSKLVFKLGVAQITSSTNIKAKSKYEVDIFKYKKYIFMFIDSVFEGYTNIDFSLNEDILSDLLIGRYRTNPDYDFQGFIYDFYFENYFRDTENLLTRYLPENVSLTSVLNFENDLYDEGDPKRIWSYSNENSELFLDPISTKYGDYSLTLNSTNNYITAEREPVFNLGTDDFTIETWINIKSYNTYSTLLANGVDQTSNLKETYRYLYINSTGKLVLGGSKEGLNSSSTTLIESATNIPLNSWVHVAVTRASGVFRTYLSGSKTKEVIFNNASLDFSILGAHIGNNNWESSTLSQLDANLDSFRLVKGKALYVGDTYTVPDKAFGTLDTNKIVDLSFEPLVLPTQRNNQLLYNFNPVYETGNVIAKVVNPETVFGDNIDESSIQSFILNFENAFQNTGSFTVPLSTTKTSPTDAVFQTAVTKFGTRALKMDHRVMSIPGKTFNNNIFVFNNKDFSIDFWTYETSRALSTYKVIFSSIDRNISLVHSYSNVFSFNQASTSGLGWSNDDIKRPLNQWNHVAYCRKGTNVYLFCNGVLQDTKKVAADSYIDNMGITGTNFSGSGWTTGDNMTGFLDGFRVIRGYGMFTQDFSVSSLKEPKINEYQLKDYYFEYNPEHVFEDYDEFEFHDKSISFTGDSAAVQDSFDLLVAPFEDFTLEFNIRFKNSEKDEEIIIKNSGTDGIFKISRSNVPGEDLHILSVWYEGNLLLKSKTKLENNIWYDITVTRYKELLKLFIDGILDSRELSPTLQIDFKTRNLILGEDFKGNIESLRLTPKLSLYKSSYQTPNVYFDKYNNTFNVTYKVYDKVLESATKSTVHTLTTPLALRLKEESKEAYLESNLINKSGITITDPGSVSSFNTDSFVIEYRARLMLDKSFDVFKGIDNNQNYSKAIYSSITSTYDSTFKNSVVMRVNGINLTATFPETLVGTWLTVRLEREGTSLKLYVNSVLRDTKVLTDTNVNMKNYSSNFFIAKNTDGTVMDIDYLSIMKGNYLNRTATESRPSVIDVYEDKLEIIKSTDQNLIPENSYFENLVSASGTPKYVTTTNINSLRGFSSYYDGSSYLRLENFPELPASLIIDFWVLPNDLDSTFFKAAQSETDLTKGILIKQSNGFLGMYIKSENGATITLTSTTQKLLINEWNNIRVLFKEGVLSLYLNGQLIEEETNPNPGFFKSLLGRLYLGHNPSAPDSYFKGYMDSLTIDKATLNSAYGYLSFSPVQELFLKYSVLTQELDLKSSDVSQGTVGWDLISGSSLEIKAKGTPEENYFSKASTSEFGRVYQDIELKDYSSVDGKKLYLSWSQIRGTAGTSLDSRGGMSLEFFDEYNNSIAKRSSNFVSMFSSEKSMERYLVTSIPTGTVTLRVHLEVEGQAGIKDISLYSELLGDKFFNTSNDIEEEYIPNESYIDPSYAYRYVSSDKDISKFSTDTLVSDVDIEGLDFQKQDNILYNDVSVEDTKQAYDNDNIITVR